MRFMSVIICVALAGLFGQCVSGATAGQDAVWIRIDYAGGTLSGACADVSFNCAGRAMRLSQVRMISAGAPASVALPDSSAYTPCTLRDTSAVSAGVRFVPACAPIGTPVTGPIA